MSSDQIYAGIWEFEEISSSSFFRYHPYLSLAKARLASVSSHMFRFISDQYPDLACRLHAQIRLMGNFGLNGAIHCIINTDDALCFVFKRDTETLDHFLFDCPDFGGHFDSLWSNLCLKVTGSNLLDGEHIVAFLMSLDQHHKAMLPLGCLSLLTLQLWQWSFDLSLQRLEKIFKLRTEKLHELGNPWLTNWQFLV